MIPSIIDWANADSKVRHSALQRPAILAGENVTQGATEIIAAVVRDGDLALRQLTARYDGVQLEDFRVSEDEIASAGDQITASQLTAIDTAIRNVRRFHQAQLPASVDLETETGVRCQRVSHPIDSVGLYVPAGTAPLPSAAIMLAVPAAIAGCPQVVMCTPSRKDGSADPYIITAATRAGVEVIFKLGGAQAIAAMAYGTETVPAMAKIFGPGNAWVTAAKTVVASDPVGPAIDMPAGPSEVLVICDASANPDFVAADLLSQAEHGSDSQVVLLATDATVLASTMLALDRQLVNLDRIEIATAALGNSCFILATSTEEAIAISNNYAPEHLIVQCEDARSLLPQIRNAGSVFLGPWSPESAGDYCSGTNHVLPTYGAAKKYSGLSVDQFMRQMTVQELSRDGLMTLAPTIIELATMEGLDAHANAVRCRLDGES